MGHISTEIGKETKASVFKTIPGEKLYPLHYWLQWSLENWNCSLKCEAWDDASSQILNKYSCFGKPDLMWVLNYL